MPDKMHRVVVDTQASVLQSLLSWVGAILLLGAGTILAVDSLANPVRQDADRNKVVRDLGDAFLSWFVWKDPLVVLAVIVPLAIALQVAVHGLRAEQDSPLRKTIHAVRTRDHEIRRVRLFSRIAMFSAGLVSVFTITTVTAELASYNGKPDLSQALTVALSGGVTAILCLDAARIATTQDLERRLAAASVLLKDRKVRLSSLKRDLPKRKLLWASSCLLAAVLTAPPVYLLKYSDGVRESSNLPDAVEKLALVVVLSTFLAGLLALNFVATLALTVGQTMPLLYYIVVLVIFGLLPWVGISAGFRAWSKEPTAASYAWIVFPAVAYISAVIAWIQGTRGTSSWITRYTFGFQGLFRFWSARMLARLLLNSHGKVSWLREALRDETALIRIGGLQSGRRMTCKDRNPHQRHASGQVPRRH